MSLVYYNLDIIQGSRFSALLFAPNADGTAVSLPGYNVRGVIKYNFGTGTALTTLSPSINTTSVDPTHGGTYTAASGVIDVSVSAPVTAGLPVGIGVYDIEMYSGPEGNETDVRKLLDGRVRIHPEVTR